MGESPIHATAHADADLLPVRMCNELVYCPRLFHLEHVQGVFVHSADTVRGAAEHERAKRRGTKLRVANASTGADERPAAELAEGLPKRCARQSEALGVRGEIDLVEVSDGSVVVVEAKHGKAPRGTDHRWEDHDLPYRAWPADVAQLALYMALLREMGMPCEEGRIFYRASNRSVTIPWSEALERFAIAVVKRAQEVSRLDVAPEPLIDSPKCPGCSLHDVCLPDEHHALRSLDEASKSPIRKIVPGSDDRSVVHVLDPGSVVRKDGDGLVVQPREGDSRRFLLHEVGHVALFGRVHVTEPCMQHLLRTGTPVSHHTSTGRLLGTTSPLMTRNIALRRAQYRAADDAAACTEISRALVVAKIRNQRTVLKRHRRGLRVVDTDSPLEEGHAKDERASAPESNRDATPKIGPAESSRKIAAALDRMRIASNAAQRCSSIDALRGHEGDAAACYFDVFALLLPPAWQGDFGSRSRRPPRDRVNALLSFGYSMLLRDAVAALSRIGLDPMLGVFHTMIPGRPALALDLVEPFRAAWVDTAMLRLIATGGIQRSQFHVSGSGVQLSDAGRRAAIRAYERRASELTTHPRFGYRMSYRRLVELEARILAKVVAGELEEYTPLWTR